MKRILIVAILVANLSVSQKIMASERELHANQDTSEGNSGYSVQVNTMVQDNPPAIEFSWDEISGSQYIRIYKIRVRNF